MSWLRPISRVASSAPAQQLVLGLTLLASLLTATSIARAQVDLRWDAPPGCPQRDAVLSRIRRLAGGSLENMEGLSAEATIERVNGRFWLTLLVRDGQEVRKRVIKSDSCADLTGAAAVALALLMGVEVRPDELGAEGSGGASDGSETGTGDTSAPSSGDSKKGEDQSKRGDQAKGKPGDERADQGTELPSGSESTRAWGLILRGPVGTVDLGPLPSPAPGVGLGVGMEFSSWQILLTGHLSRHQSTYAPEPDDNAGADLKRLTGELLTCRGWRWAKFELAPCLAFSVEHVIARGFGESVTARSRRATWPGLGAGAIARWYTTESLAFFLGGAGYIELSRPRLVIEGLGEMAQMTPFMVGATVGAEWIL